MLTSEQLSGSLTEAGKAAGVCTRLCRVGTSVDSNRYLCWHNGLGNSDSDEAAVHATAALALSPSQMEARFKAWLEALHRHQPYDLNTGA